jgi:hypothetical protein
VLFRSIRRTGNAHDRLPIFESDGITSRLSGDSSGALRNVRVIRIYVDEDRERIRASSAASTGVLPYFTTCLGSRTAWAGFTTMTCPTTSLSNSTRKAARCYFTVGLECVRCSSSIQAAT